MKKTDLCFSYLMGTDDKVLELEKEGFQIKKDEDCYMVSFPKEKSAIYENYIFNNLKEGYWNEYIGDNVVFIFKFRDGTIKKFILDSSNYDTILNLCCEFANTKFDSIEDMLLGNGFYKNNVKF